MMRNLLLTALLLASALATRAATLEGLPGTPFTPSAAPLGRLALTVGLGAAGHSDETLIEKRRFLYDLAYGTLDPDTAEIQDLQSGSLRANVVLGVASWLELGLSAPWHLDHIGDLEADVLSGMGLGDVTLSAKAGGALAGDHILDAALLGSVSLPSKSPEGFLPKHTGYLGSRDSSPAGPRFHSAYGVGWAGRALLSLDLTRLEAQIPFRAHLNAGLKDPGLGGMRVLAGGALEWAPLPFFGFFADAETETRLSRFDKAFGKDLLLVSGGLNARSDDGVFFSVGVRKRVSDLTHRTFAKPADGRVFWFRAGSVPDLSLGISLGWSGTLVAQDMDKDGVPDNQDPCPNDAEDLDGFQDFDGCPERDNDEDSIPDVKDRCPIEAEDRDGTEDGDGCPDPDNDGDNIPDALDKCPIEPEDLDGFEDYDGCPDLDNDQDGVIDQNDKCPKAAEDKDGHQDSDGCPDLDNDGDRIPDSSDKCPFEAETVNGREDDDGCPEEGAAAPAPAPLPGRTLLRSVRFRGTSDELLPAAYPALDSLAARLVADPSAEVEIRAYIDKSGGEAQEIRVSEAWAVAVRKYLILKGVPATRLQVRGMGSRDPIASNSTASGRAQNRRVEIHRLP